MVSFVIEHMEEDEESTKTFPPWVQLEYSHMRTLAGPSSSVYFTNVSQSASRSLNSLGESSKDDLAKAEVHTLGVLQLMQSRGVPLENVDHFDWFLFGGILGDDPPRDRTSELRSLGFPSRHLGPIQMTTDTALGVTKLIVVNKIKLDDIPYIDFPTIRFNAQESVEMPFRYICQGGQPTLPPGMRELLYEDLDKGFDIG